MDTIKITTVEGTEKKLTLYKSINELPIKRYQLLQKYSLIDAGIGSTYDDVIRHLTRMDDFIGVKDIESINTERENMLMNFNFMLTEQYVKSYVFACLIKKIDGELIEVTDDSIDDIVEMLELSDITVGMIDDITKLQKKNFNNELAIKLPKLFGEYNEDEFLDNRIEQIKIQWMAEVDLLIGENVEHSKAILEQIKEDLLEQMRPYRFNEGDSSSIIHKREESFERLCYRLRKNNIQSPQDLSTYTFYSSILLIKEELDKQTRHSYE